MTDEDLHMLPFLSWMQNCSMHSYKLYCCMTTTLVIDGWRKTNAAFWVCYKIVQCILVWCRFLYFFVLYICINLGTIISVVLLNNIHQLELGTTLSCLMAQLYLLCLIKMTLSMYAWVEVETCLARMLSNM